MAQIPVEIFEIISSHLTRPEVKNLRLVCREFEAKVSAQYFRNVVVPFRSQLYNNLGRDENGALKHSTSTLLSNGMRIFESFGPHILRFALSLELDEDTLAYPPVKPVQEAVPAFWGVYRWPHETYHRYTDLEGLEQTADETQSMKEALMCLSKVANLGLCCDAGLGFLVGPDHVARKAAVRKAVFDTQDWRQNQQRNGTPAITVADFNDISYDAKQAPVSAAESFKRKVLETMVAEAGYNGAPADEAIELLLETEATSLTNIEFDERSVNVIDSGRRQSIFSGMIDLEPESEPESESDADVTKHALVPTNLTIAQKELLLELEWAHRAMIQSYVIGIIDNAVDGRFDNLSTLTIAKIPSSHLHILMREELWKSLPSLKNVSIGVIADWRRVSKLTPSYIEDEPVSPLEAVSKAFTLLNDYIGKQPNIESIRFEWICGGELAPSSYQRNQYILPAPFFEQPNMMASHSSARVEADKLLNLPHVKHLALKNCWVAPHVLLQTVRQMSLSSLEKIEFESVSLSGPPTRMAQRPLINNAFGQNHNADQAAGGNQGVLNVFTTLGQNAASFQPATFGIADDSSQDTLQEPHVLSWAGILEHFSPGVKIRDLMAQEEADEIKNVFANKLEHMSAFLPNTGELVSDESKYKLKCISFKSCGYVCVDTAYLDTRAVLPFETRHGFASYANNHNQEISSSMQYCGDKLFGRIVPFVPTLELSYLEDVFEMEFGWEKVYGQQIIDDAMADGIEFPGLARFSGVISSDNTTSRWHTTNFEE